MSERRWRVFYADGSTVDDRTAVGDVPARGVLVVVVADPDVGRLILSGHDYYAYRPGEETGEWFGIFDQFGLWDYLASPGMKRVLFGRTVATETYREAYQRALETEGFERKSAWHADREQERERPPGASLE